MRGWSWRWIVACAGGLSLANAVPVLAQPSRQAMEPEYQNVYAQPVPDRPGQGINEGGVHLEMDVACMTDYVYRGVDQGEWIASQEDPADPDPPRPETDPKGGHEDAANIQPTGELFWDLGKAPHPFAGVFVNVHDSDPESSFQEIRPYAGLDLNLRPILFSVAYISYIHPDRDQLDTTEVMGRIEIDDSYFYKTDEPFFSPYVLAAYDLDLYDGIYAEAGVEHDFAVNEWGVMLTAQASVGYVESHPLFTVPGKNKDTGFQHYQFGLIGTYELNSALNIPLRFGTWIVRGAIYYTDGIDDELRADTQFWGGGSIGFTY
jgi:hypothetical protein